MKNFPYKPVFVIDVDGTLTNGMYLVSSNGDITKQFYTRDFEALRQLQSKGYYVLVISSADDDVFDKKLSQLGPSSKRNLYYFKNVSDKRDFIQNIINRKVIKKLSLKFNWSDIFYIGDGDNDLPSMKKSGFVACPADATESVRSIADWKMESNGGAGAVYECINKYLSNSR